jgi:hypothetical protein
MGMAFGTHGENMNVFSILMRNPEGKRLLGRRRRMWVDNIKTYLRQSEAVRTGLIWLRIGTSGGLL